MAGMVRFSDILLARVKEVNRIFGFGEVEFGRATLFRASGHAAGGQQKGRRGERDVADRLRSRSRQPAYKSGFENV